MTLRSRPTRTRALALVAALGLAVAVAACGSDDSTSTAGDDASTTSTTESPAAATGTVVEVTDSDLGDILASGGKTLYTYAPDEAGAPTCTDKCATVWPPLLAPEGAAAGDGLDGSLVATVARPDGTQQVTVDGWPVYTYSKDTATGDVNGQGVGDIWYVVGSDGKKVDDDDAPTVGGGY